jgi:hypothetical protein
MPNSLPTLGKPSPITALSKSLAAEAWGLVYKAEDTRLGRFEAERKASLISAVHGFGSESVRVVKRSRKELGGGVLPGDFCAQQFNTKNAAIVVEAKTDFHGLCRVRFRRRTRPMNRIPEMRHYFIGEKSVDRMYVRSIFSTRWSACSDLIAS